MYQKAQIHFVWLGNFGLTIPARVKPGWILLHTKAGNNVLGSTRLPAKKAIKKNLPEVHQPLSLHSCFRKGSLAQLVQRILS